MLPKFSSEAQQEPTTPDGTGSGGGTTNPLLTIFVPSYRRSRRARALLSHLLPLVEEFDGAIELIVSINPPSEPVAEPCQLTRAFDGLNSRFLRLLVQPAHLETAEQHIFQGLRACRGEYVLFHGDDDLTVLPTLRSLVYMLHNRRHDCVAFTSIMIGEDNRNTGGALPKMTAAAVDVPFVTGGLALGFMCCLAGISNIVQRREPLLLCDIGDLFVLEPIYAHVTWRLKAFHDCRLTIVNRPLVQYRSDTGETLALRFRELATARGVGDFHFWGIGLIRHLDFLLRNRVLNVENIKTAFDFRRDGSNFRLMDNIVRTVEAQVRLGATSGAPRNRLTSDQLSTAADWILKIDPSYFEPVQSILLMTNAAERQDGSPDLDETHRLFNEQMQQRDEMNKSLGLVGFYRSYAIYSHLLGLIAFDERHLPQCQESLRIVDLESSGEGRLAIRWPQGVTPDLDLTMAEMHRLIDDIVAKRHLRRESHPSWMRDLETLLEGTNASLKSELARARGILEDAEFLIALGRLERETTQVRWWFDKLTGFNREYYRRTYGVRWRPLRHFLDVGWREGNDPSAAFSTRGYLAANTDVAEAKINPLVHFVTYGRKEKRKGWY